MERKSPQGKDKGVGSEKILGDFMPGRYFRDESIYKLSALVNSILDTEEQAQGDAYAGGISLVEDPPGEVNQAKRNGSELVELDICASMEDMCLEGFYTPPRKQGVRRIFTSPQLVDPSESFNAEPLGHLFQSPAKRRAGGSGLPHLASGFHTGTGKNVRIPVESMDRARKSLDFEAMEICNVPSNENRASNKKMGGDLALSQRNEEGRSRAAHAGANEEKISLMERILSELRSRIGTKRMISAEEEHCILSIFKWSWISQYMRINEILGKPGTPLGPGESKHERVREIVIDQAMRRWNLQPLSVLKRIAERDESPGVYMKLMILESREGALKVTDGLYAVNVSLDKELRRIAQGKFFTGKVIQVVGSKALLPAPTGIDEVESGGLCLLELNYNGVKPAAGGVLGYQREHLFLRSLASIRKGGGIVGCVDVEIVHVHGTKYLMDLNGSRNTIEEERFNDSMERVEKSIKQMRLSREEEIAMMKKVRVKKFTKMEIRDAADRRRAEHPCILTLWNPPENILRRGRSLRIFYLTTYESPYDHQNSLTLSSLPQTIIRPLDWI